jgi:hypothetical protein
MFISSKRVPLLCPIFVLIALSVFALRRSSALQKSSPQAALSPTRLIVALLPASARQATNQRHLITHRSGIQKKAAHLPAIVESFSSLDNLTCRSDTPRSFRVRDKVIFLRRSENGMIYKGRGEVKDVVDDGVMITVLNPKFGVDLLDEVYITQRDNSPDSLSKLPAK